MGSIAVTDFLITLQRSSAYSFEYYIVASSNQARLFFVLIVDFIWASSSTAYCGVAVSITSYISFGAVQRVAKIDCDLKSS